MLKVHRLQLRNDDTNEMFESTTEPRREMVVTARRGYDWSVEIGLQDLAAIHSSHGQRVRLACGFNLTRVSHLH